MKRMSALYWLTELHESFGWWHIVSFFGGLWGFGGRQLVFYLKFLMELWVIPSSISELLSDNIVTLFTEAVYWSSYILHGYVSADILHLDLSRCLSVCFDLAQYFLCMNLCLWVKKCEINLNIINQVKIVRNKLIHILRLKKLQWWKTMRCWQNYMNIKLEKKSQLWHKEWERNSQL